MDVCESFMDIPWVITVDILSRLPIRLIFQCKAVCKLWYKILYPDPLFVKIYQTRSLRFPCILCSGRKYHLSLLELKASYYYYTRCNRPIPLTDKFHFPPEDVSLVGSCNGFICLAKGWRATDKHSIYISNPLLGEYFELEVPEWETSVSHVAYRFCFSEVSRQYKVLRLVVRRLTEASELDVYTLGVGEIWRKVGELPDTVQSTNFGKACVNGALHWMDSGNSDCIYSIDIETEKIKSFPTPPGLDSESSTLAKAGDYLCLTDYVDMYSDYINVWWMKEYGVAESWTKDCISVNSLKHGRMSRHSFQPILIWKDGEILVQSVNKLASYNPESKMFIPVNVYGDFVFEATRYIPSFYSLKTIMGDDFQVTHVYPKTEILKLLISVSAL